MHPSVLLVDLDSQGNATMGSGVDKRELAASTYDLLLGESSAADVRVQTAEGYDLLPGNIDLTAAEIQLMAQSEREQRLKRALAPIRDEYDYILIDCPPALSLLTLNALAAADSVIVPMQCEYYALEGLSALVETIEALRADLNPALEIEGVLRTMFDVRNNRPTRCRPSSPSTSAIACSAPSCRATCAWPRHPAMARASSATTAPRAVAWPTWAWPARSSAATTNATRPPRPWRPSDDQQQAGSQEARPRPWPGRAAGPEGRGQPGAGHHGGDRAAAGEVLRKLPVGQLQPGKYQPRREMDEGKLSELADSIKSQGVIQPILVRQLPAGNYEIVAGERRWRASQLAGLDEVPVVVRELEDRTVIAMALIENIQREDLNPLEEAEALQRLISEFTLTHAEAAEAVGRSRAAVSNPLRLLELPVAIRLLLETRRLEMGHARALLTLAPNWPASWPRKRPTKAGRCARSSGARRPSPPARCRAAVRWPRRRCSRPTSPRWKPSCPKRSAPRWRSATAVAARAS